MGSTGEADRFAVPVTAVFDTPTVLPDGLFPPTPTADGHRTSLRVGAAEIRGLLLHAE